MSTRYTDLIYNGISAFGVAAKWWVQNATTFIIPIDSENCVTRMMLVEGVIRCDGRIVVR